MWLDEEKVRIRRERIREAIFRLFCEYGMEQPPIEQIAKQPDMQKYTVYRYFKDKMSLVIDILVHLWETFTHSIRGPCVAMLQSENIYRGP